MTDTEQEGKDYLMQGKLKEGTGLSREKQYACMTILIMAFIFIQSALSGELSGKESGFIAGLLAAIFHRDMENLSFFVRKGAHFTEYLFLGVSLSLWIRERVRAGKSRLGNRAGGRFRGLSPAAWAAGTAYAVTDEIHQIFVADRSGQIRDVVIDSAGVLAGVLLIRIIRQRNKPEKASKEADCKKM